MEREEMERTIERLVRVNEDPALEFQLLQPLGVGSYGWVHKAYHESSGCIVAVKRVALHEYDNIANCLKELEILEACRCPQIVGFRSAHIKDNELWIAMEYCAGGSVKDIRRLIGRPFEEKVIAALMCSVLRGLVYLHQNRMIHRDVKADNVLLDDDGCAKIADFGVSARLMSTYAGNNTFIGTPFWMSPEILAKNVYTAKTDIWSLGITAIELAEGEPPYAKSYPWLAMEKIKKNPPRGLSEPQRWSPAFNDFVRRCLTLDPDERPTSEDLLQDPFIQSGAVDERRVLRDLFRATHELVERARQKGDRRASQLSGSPGTGSATESPPRAPDALAASESPKSFGGAQPCGTIIYHGAAEPVGLGLSVACREELPDRNREVELYAQKSAKVRAFEERFQISAAVTLSEIRAQIDQLKAELAAKLDETRKVYAKTIEPLEDFLAAKSELEAQGVRLRALGVEPRRPSESNPRYFTESGLSTRAAPKPSQRNVPPRFAKLNFAGAKLGAARVGAPPRPLAVPPLKSVTGRGRLLGKSPINAKM